MYYFIINPLSSSGHGLNLWQEAAEILNEKNIEYEAFFTEYKGHAMELAKQIAALSLPCTLGVLGGDGTLNEVINGLMQTDFSHITLGYIPTGSGNDFARGLGLPTDVYSCISMILSPKEIISLDIGQTRTPDFSRYFIVSSGIGYDAGICAQVSVTPLKKILNKLKLGKLTYVFVALKQLIIFKPCPISIRLDHKKTFRFPKFFFLAAMNMKYEGGGAKFCPDAKYDDEFLDFCLVGELSKLKILTLFPTAFIGKHTLFRGVHIKRCRHMEVITQKPLPVHCDGEIPGTATQVTFTFGKEKIKTIKR